MSSEKSQDQRSLTDQLQDVWEFARKEKMYDAADFIVSKMKKFKTVVDGKEIRVLPIVSKGGGSAEEADVKNAVVEINTAIDRIFERVERCSDWIHNSTEWSEHEMSPGVDYWDYIKQQVDEAKMLVGKHF